MYTCSELERFRSETSDVVEPPTSNRRTFPIVFPVHRQGGLFSDHITKVQQFLFCDGVIFPESGT